MFKIPKTAHFYFGHQTVSFLRFLSVFSFSRQNPDWQIVFHRPCLNEFRRAVSWKTGEFYEAILQGQKDYFEELVKLPNVQVKEAVVPGNRDWLNGWPEPYKADYARWSVLSSEGGLFADTDILFIKPMSDLTIDGNRGPVTDTVLCTYHRLHRVGVLMACPGNQLFKDIEAEAEDAFDPGNYQSIGPCLMNEIAPTPHDISVKYPSLVVFNMPFSTFYPFDEYTIPFAFEFESDMFIPASTIGIHWYGGHPLSQFYNWKIDHRNYRKFNSLFARKISEVYP